MVVTDIRLMGHAGSVEVHIKVDGIWRRAIKERCGDTESCDHFTGFAHAETWPESDWANKAKETAADWKGDRELPVGEWTDDIKPDPNHKGDRYPDLFKEITMTIDTSDLITRLAGAGEDAINDKGAEQLDNLLARGTDLANEWLTEEAGMEDLHAPVLEALAELGKPEMKQAALRLGNLGLAWVVSLVADGQEAEARRRYIQTEATFEERLAFQRAAGDRAELAAREAADSWDVLLSGLKAAGLIAVKALGFLLLAGLGL